jgi:hypothetical protein
MDTDSLSREVSNNIIYLVNQFFSFLNKNIMENLFNWAQA